MVGELANEPLELALRFVQPIRGEGVVHGGKTGGETGGAIGCFAACGIGLLLGQSIARGQARPGSYGLRELLGARVRSATNWVQVSSAVRARAACCVAWACPRR